ncbi:SelB C-terminal domain-containing protein, partial [Mycolicibacterium vaccae]|nr:SelB C-terminal domain-containing protein [Mycolicibacterium vaccae]
SGRRVGEWVVEEQWWAQRRQQLVTAVARWSAAHDIAAGVPMEELRREIGLPAVELLAPLVAGTGLELADGRVRRPGDQLPERVDKAVRTIEERLAAEPFRAPDADELADLDLGAKELAAAVRAGRLTKVADGVVLGPFVVDQATQVLQRLPQPFTVTEAKRALNTTRRVAVPLLEMLAHQRVTRKDPDGTHRVTG